MTTLDPKAGDTIWHHISSAPKAYKDADCESFNRNIGGLGIAKDYDTGRPICLLWWVRAKDGFGWTPSLWAKVPKSPSAEQKRLRP